MVFEPRPLSRTIQAPGDITLGLHGMPMDVVCSDHDFVAAGSLATALYSLFVVFEELEWRLPTVIDVLFDLTVQATGSC
jgi:hypothetical protein